MRLLRRTLISLAFCAALIPLSGCDESVGTPPAGTGAGTGGQDALNEGTELTVDVPETGRVYIDLAKAAVVTPKDGPNSLEWSLAMSGYDVLTNSGPSGPGDGSAFGPLDSVEIQADTKPVVPFVTPDTTGGAFLDWWKYDNVEHVIWSRYHLYGIKDGARYWKVQVITFYGVQQGAPVSALYQIRYAEVKNGSVGPTTTLTDIDGTAGGPSPLDSTPSDCLDLDTGALIPLTPAEAIASTAWHLCFRRSIINVNGEYGGPKGVLAVDLDAAQTEGETLEAVKMKTADSELPRFDALDDLILGAPGLVYRGDHIVTAFTDLWTLPGSSPPALRDAAWLVIGPDGTSNYVIVFNKFEGATTKTPGKVTMHIKAVKGG